MITSANDHVNATPIVREAWKKLHGREGTANEILYSQAIASFETGYGRLGQFAEFAKQGKFNWGAEQRKPNDDGSCPTGYILGKDQGNVCFRYFNNDVDAAANFLRTLTKSPLRPAVVTSMEGSPEDVARAMRGPNPPQGAYYAGAPNTTEDQKIAVYANGIRTRAKQIAEALKNSPLLPTTVKTADYTYPALILAMTGSAWFLVRKDKK